MEDTLLKSLYIYLNEMDFESQKYVKLAYKIIILIVAVFIFIVSNNRQSHLSLHSFQRDFPSVFTQPSELVSSVFCYLLLHGLCGRDINSIGRKCRANELIKMHINVRQSSKSRILIHLIEQYHKTPQEEALLFTSKLNSITQIDKRYNRSEINQNYVFPRQEIEEVVPETPQNNFKDLLTKIYVTSQKKVQTHAQLKQELLKKSYSIFQQKKPLIKSNKNSTLKLQQSLSQVRMHTDISLKQPSQKQSRGQSPEIKIPNTNRSISTQLMKFVNQKKKEIQLFNGCKSFESRQQFNRSPQLLQNKSYDYSKNIKKLK